jgi:leishmanolysin-like peptidase
MEDTGWYKANYSLAQDLSWGKNLGCDFVTKSCKQWMDMKRAKGQSIHPFCNKVKRDPLETECTDDRSSVALCNLVEHVQPLPTIYQVSKILIVIFIYFFIVKFYEILILKFHFNY